jgi:hypothetical protein
MDGFNAHTPRREKWRPLLWVIRRNNRRAQRPIDEAERFSVASTCVRKLGIKFPALIDGFDNRVEARIYGMA